MENQTRDSNQLSSDICLSPELEKALFDLKELKSKWIELNSQQRQNMSERIFESTIQALEKAKQFGYYWEI